MSDNSETPSAQFLGGQLAAQLALLRALIETHPNRDALRQGFSRRRDLVLKATLPETTNSDYAAGVNEQSRALWLGF